MVGEADKKNSAKKEKEGLPLSEQELNCTASATGSSVQQEKTPKKSKRKG